MQIIQTRDLKIGNPEESSGAAVNVEDVEYVLNAVDDDEQNMTLCE